jgi:hypothetical protein
MTFLHARYAAFVITALGLSCANVRVSSAASTTCLTGQDPSVAGDIQKIAGVRHTVEEIACPGALFDGSTHERSHGAYVKCAGNVIKAAARTGVLRRQCVNTTKKIYKLAAPGLPTINQTPRVPCIVKTSDGGVQCRLVFDCPGGVLCPDFWNCQDAADTNEDGVIGPGDSGACNFRALCGNGVREASEQCDAPGAVCPTGSGCTADCQCVPCAECPARDQCHVAGACSNGISCSPPAPDGTPCDNGNACRLDGATCQDGVCTSPSSPAPPPGSTNSCICSTTDPYSFGGLQTCDPDGTAPGLCIPQVGNCIVNASSIFGSEAGASIPTVSHLAGHVLRHPRIHIVLWNNDAAFYQDPIKTVWQDYPAQLAKSRLYRAILNNYDYDTNPGGAFSATLGSIGIADGDYDQGGSGITLPQAATRITEAINSGAVPAPDGGYYDDFYIVLLPPYKHIACSSCGAQHSSFLYNGHEAYYEHLETGDANFNPVSLDVLQRRISHEYGEAVTDPVCDGWYGGNCFTDEIADNCNPTPSPHQYWHESDACTTSPWVLAPLEHGGSCVQPVIGGRICSGTSDVGTTCTAFEVGDFHNQDFGDNRWPVDWSPGSFKAECPPGSTLRGMSVYSSAVTDEYGNRRWAGLIWEHDFAHDILCANDAGPAVLTQFPKDACTVRDISTGNDRATTATGDWDQGSWKGECANDEYVGGVSQTPDGQVTDILCCRSPVVTHTRCATRTFADQEAREPSLLCDWDEGFYKGECGNGRYVAGVSVDPHHNGGPVSLLCCDMTTNCTAGTACGSCGDGFCVDHCDGFEHGSDTIGELCVTSKIGPDCASDADCAGTPATPYCISNGNCRGGGSAATCRALCGTTTSTTTTTTTTVPPCTAGTLCGSCGTGFCVDHCSGTSVIGELCVTNVVGPHCATDADCAATPGMPYCISNGNCGAPGNNTTCRALCTAPCGNGICEAGENANTCPADCSPVCGNGVCEPGEVCDFGCGPCCCVDCGCGNCGGVCRGSTPETSGCQVQ